MTQVQVPDKPTSEDLAKAVWELSTLVGILPPRIEKELVMETVLKLIKNWWLSEKSLDYPVLKNIQEFENWLDTKSFIKQASSIGYQMHLDSK
jgi:hypothetical protein